MTTSERPVRIEVPGRPVPKSRPRVTSYGTYSDKRQVAKEEEVGWEMRMAIGSRIFRGPIEVKVLFVCPNHTHGDVDNLLKLVLDAGNGIAWNDDKQVRRATGEIEIDGSNPRTVIEIIPR